METINLGNGLSPVFIKRLKELYDKMWIGEVGCTEAEYTEYREKCRRFADHFMRRYDKIEFDGK